MRKDFPVPAETRLQQLIVETYELLEGPDSGRISLIGGTLRAVQTAGPAKGSNKLPWWIVLLLAGGAATAAWWVPSINKDSEQARVVSTAIHDHAVSGETGTDVTINAEQSPPGLDRENDDDSKVIIQREKY